MDISVRLETSISNGRSLRGHHAQLPNGLSWSPRGATAEEYDSIPMRVV